MADLNALIAQGAQFRPPPDPFAQYAQMQQLQQGAQANQLNQLKMQEYQRESAATNALNQAYQAAYNPATGAYDMGKLRGAVIGAGAGAKLPGIEEGMSKLAAQKAAQSKAEAEAVTQKLALSRSLLDTIDPNDPSAPQRFMAWHEANHTDPVLGPVLQRVGATAEQSRASIVQAIEQGPAALADLIAKSREGQTKFAERFKPITVAPGASVFRPGDTGAMFTAPEKTPAPSADMQGYELAKAEGFKGTFFDFKRQLAQAGRAPAQPAAATVAQIQNPANPNEMITIDARTYKGGGVGSPGVLGLAGKTPVATAKQDAVNKGVEQVKSTIDDLRASYQTLNAARAIPSTQRGALSNIAASTQASDVGQFLGRVTGTEAQSARDTINSSRLILLNGIKQATGMSSQQLNSNVELQTWLKAVSDPKQAVETTDKILDHIEKFIATGGKYSVNKPPAPTGVDGSKPSLDSIFGPK